MIPKTTIDRELIKGGNTLVTKSETGDPPDISLIVLNSKLDTNEGRIRFINNKCGWSCERSGLYSGWLGDGKGYMGWNNMGLVQVFYTDLLSKQLH